MLETHPAPLNIDVGPPKKWHQNLQIVLINGQRSIMDLQQLQIRAYPITFTYQPT